MSRLRTPVPIQLDYVRQYNYSKYQHSKNNPITKTRPFGFPRGLFVFFVTFHTVSFVEK